MTTDLIARARGVVERNGICENTSLYSALADALEAKERENAELKRDLASAGNARQDLMDDNLKLISERDSLAEQVNAMREALEKVHTWNPCANFNERKIDRIVCAALATGDK